jgi:hypothetical protein
MGTIAKKMNAECNGLSKGKLNAKILLFQEMKMKLNSERVKFLKKP